MGVVQLNIYLDDWYYFFVLCTFSTSISSFVAVFAADSELVLPLKTHTDVLMNKSEMS